MIVNIVMIKFTLIISYRTQPIRRTVHNNLPVELDLQNREGKAGGNKREVSGRLVGVRYVS